MIISRNKSKNYFFRYKHPKGFSLTSLAWNPQVEGQIAFCDKEVNNLI